MEIVDFLKRLFGAESQKKSNKRDRKGRRKPSQTQTSLIEQLLIMDLALHGQLEFFTADREDSVYVTGSSDDTVLRAEFGDGLKDVITENVSNSVLLDEMEELDVSDIVETPDEETTSDSDETQESEESDSTEDSLETDDDSTGEALDDSGMDTGGFDGGFDGGGFDGGI